MGMGSYFLALYHIGYFLLAKLQHTCCHCKTVMKMKDKFTMGKCLSRRLNFTLNKHIWSNESADIILQIIKIYNPRFSLE